MTLTALLLGSSAFASGAKLPAYVQACTPLGLEKLKTQAAIDGETVHEDTLHVNEIDDRWYNPSKYVWYAADVTTPGGTVEERVALVQSSDGKCY